MTTTLRNKLSEIKNCYSWRILHGFQWFVFSKSMLGLFQFAELTEVIRQRDDKKFIELLNKIGTGNVDEDVQK